MNQLLATLLIITMLISFSAPCFSSKTSYTTTDPASQFLKTAVEAADWISSFQVTPLSSTWGIPYPDERVWGLDPFYYSNGTITSDTDDIQAGARQQLAFLIAGHDAGEGANAALNTCILPRTIKSIYKSSKSTTTISNGHKS